MSSFGDLFSHITSIDSGAVVVTPQQIVSSSTKIGQVIDAAVPAPPTYIDSANGLFTLSGAGMSPGQWDSADYTAWALSPTEVIVGIRFLTAVGDTDAGVRRFQEVYVRDSRIIMDNSKDRTLVFPDDLGNWDSGTWYTWWAPAGAALTGFGWQGWRSIRSIQFQTRLLSATDTTNVVSIPYGSTQTGLGGMYYQQAYAPAGSFINDFTVWGNVSGGADNGIKYIQNIGYKDMSIIAKMIGDPVTRIGCLKGTSDAAMCSGYAELNTVLAADTLAGNWCPDHLDDQFCACFAPMPADVLAIPGMEQEKALPQCWNSTCNLHGYKNSGLSGACPSIKICTQNMASINGNSNVLSGNIVQQDCSDSVGVTISTPIVNPSVFANFSVEDMMIILILVLMLVSVAIGVKTYYPSEQAARSTNAV